MSDIHLIKNARIYAPADMGIQNLLIGGGEILRISKKPIHLDAALKIEETNLKNAPLIPGFIDGHVHITGGGGEAGASTRVPPVKLGHYTRSGITTVIGLLGTDDTTRSTSSLIATVNGLREEGLSAWCYSGGYHIPPTTLTGSVKSDMVHVDCIIGMGELAISDHRSSQPTFDELLKLASEVHVGGLMTGKAGLLHLHMGDGKRGLELVRRAITETELPARTFNPTHVNRRKALFDEACELAEQGCNIDLTAFPVEEGEDAWSAADALIIYLKKNLPETRITISSDAGGCLPEFDRQGELISMDFAHPGALMQTLTELLDKGQKLPEILPAFTSNVAGLLRLNKKGQIKEGFDADLVVLDNVNKIQNVMAGGRWHIKEKKQLLFGTFEHKIS